ncbi:MAG: phage portal protein [Methanofastidiosum sp.]|jgi:HK97 family phage portal protein
MRFLKWEIRNADRSDLLNPKKWLEEALTGKRSKIKITVNEDTAMRQSAVYGCVRILAETIASLPLNVYERLKNGKNKKIDHPLYYLLHDKPNKYMTSFSWRETVMATLLLRGNSINQIIRNNRGDIIEIYPLPYNRARVEIKDGNVIYTYNDNNGDKIFDNNEVLHIPGLSLNGIIGISPIQYAREAIAYSTALEEFGELFFENRTNIGGVATHPGKLSEQGSKNLRQSINENYAGLGNSYKVMLLEEGLKFEPITIAPADAQYLELRKFQLEEIARIYRVPLHLLQNLDRATFGNIEHQSIDFAVHTIRPWLVRIEQAFNTKLFKENEIGKYFSEFVIDGLLRGDTATRWEAYTKALQNGVYSPNDVLELENRNPYPGGDRHFIQLNMQPIDNPISLENKNIVIDGQEIRIFPEVKEDKKAIEDRQLRSSKSKFKTAQAYKGLFNQMTVRILKREKKDILDIAKKSFNSRDSQVFNEQIDLYYQSHRDFVKKQAKPIISTYSKAVAAEAADEVGVNPDLEFDRYLEKYNEGFAANYTKKNSLELKNKVAKAISEDEDPVEIVEKKLSEWEEKRPDDVATEQTVKLMGAISLLVYKIVGITKYRLINASGKSCPYCEELDGQIIGVDKYIAVDGQELGDGENIMVVNGNIKYPPIHQGCCCMVVAEG